MSGFSHLPLQKAIYSALTTDSSLMGMVTGVYDRPAQASPFPYVTIGEMSGRDWSSKTTTGMEHNIVLHAWSREGGRKEAAIIMERIHTLLHHANLTLEGHMLVLLKFMSSRLMLEDDGWTYHGTIRFAALTEAN